MCRHRPTGAWGHVWAYWLAAVLTTFGIFEGVAMATEGCDGTLSTFLRRLAGLHEDDYADGQPCRHRHLGRATILSLFGWAILHLGWGVLGCGPARHGKR